MMAIKRVTIQDIADACGLSRNTVSKIFNGRGSVPKATQKLVYRKARELGYFPRQAMEQQTEGGRGNIALLTQHKLLSHNFGAYFITSFTNQICRDGYTLKMYEVSPGEIAEKQLPPHLELTDTAGILCIELFDRDYQDVICSLDLPCAFVDGFAHANRSLLNCDFISMENYAVVRRLAERMIQAGAERIGFVGDIMHCNSFSERWEGYVSALSEAGLPVDREQCILDPDSENYGDVDWLSGKLASMPRLPDAFVCANDYLAIHLMSALKKRGLMIPEDIMVSGFDGSPEAAFVEPSLTTAQIPSAEIGRLAASLLTERIQSPDSPYRLTYVKTPPIWGGSTR